MDVNSKNKQPHYILAIPYVPTEEMSRVGILLDFVVILI